MRFRKHESELEQQLRAQRPQPRDEFVESMARLATPAQRPRRIALPKAALVAAVTVVLAASLGATGALGSAKGSVRTFGTSLVHIVSAPATPSPIVGASAPAPTSSATSTSTSSSSASPTTTDTPSFAPGEPDGHGGTSYRGTPPTFPPFRHQYGIQFPLCYQGHIIYVSPREIVWYIFHGARPARFCSGH